jgi:hypothetical protein
LFSSW